MHSQKAHLISTITNTEYPIERIQEFADNGESLEVKINNIKNAKIKTGNHILTRFNDFLPFSKIDQSMSLGEGNTSLLKANQQLSNFCGLDNLYLKNETQNPTWSFKDRGSLACIAMAKEMNEKVTATISTGNMGASMSAYGAKNGIKVLIFVPEYTPHEKIIAMGIHGATVIKVIAADYSKMKKKVLNLSKKLNLRIVSGNGPIRVEGYKITAFELFEQMKGNIPDYIAVPTSACGHIRGIFKGYKELQEAGIINKLPKMIVVQAKNNNPITSAIKQGHKSINPVSNVKTIAKAITTGAPMGGHEIIHKAQKHQWLAEDVSEKEIIQSQRKLAENGYFVEPASATSLYAIKKLRKKNKISKNSSVVMILTGSGLKDTSMLNYHKINLEEIPLDKIHSTIIKNI